MMVFSWEEQVMSLARSWSHDGTMSHLMTFVSDLRQTFILIIPALILCFYKMGWRRVVPPVLLSLIAVGLSEVVSRRIVKALVMRPRPNFIETGCAMSSCWGFISSHATNIFAIAVVLSFYDKRNAIWSIPVAVLVSFSRIYLIDHYPLDVIGGAFAGVLIGISVWFAYNEVAQRLKRQRTVSNEI